jgi:hypothetical protein
MRFSKLRSGTDGGDAKPNSKHGGAEGTNQRGSTEVTLEDQRRMGEEGPTRMENVRRRGRRMSLGSFREGKD